MTQVLNPSVSGAFSVAKKKTDRVQVNFRTDEEFMARLERVAGVLGSDVSGIVRQILHEFLPDYESRADVIEGKRQRTKREAK